MHSLIAFLPPPPKPKPAVQLRLTPSLALQVRELAVLRHQTVTAVICEILQHVVPQALEVERSRVDAEAVSA